jgi:hypothetical protein
LFQEIKPAESGYTILRGEWRRVLETAEDEDAGNGHLHTADLGKNEGALWF